MQKSVSRQKGFTLIELLVVISVIGFLASTVLIAVNKARNEAQNTRRMAEFKQGMKALELYRQDNGTYPFPVNPDWKCWGPSTQKCVGDYATGDDAVLAAMKPYIDRAPETLITESYSDGQNRLAFRNTDMGDGTHRLEVMWPYYGTMPPGLCPSLLPPGATKVVWAPSPPGYWAGFGDTSNYSYCWELYIY